MSIATEETITTTLPSDFDNNGNALKQDQVTKVFDSLGANPTETSHTTITSTYNTRGDATSQAIKTYHVEGGIETLTSDEELTNRSFDANHNCVNQMVLSYVVDKTGSRVLFNVQETRSIGFTASGVAGEVTTATYSNDLTTVLGVQVVTNNTITADGRVTDMTITKYAGRDATDVKEGDIHGTGT